MTSWQESYLLPWAARVEGALDKVLPAQDADPAIIHESMRYSALGGGKRLRGVLAVTACAASGGEPERALPLAAALEMLHAYSLVHDDLPAMDDDALRRGKPTNHIRYGEDIAILAGDALLTHAFVVLSRLPELCGVSAETGLSIVREVGEAAGTAGLIGGQVADLQAEGLGAEVTVEQLQAIHARKTGALFRACMRTGAMLAGADDDTLMLLSEYADAFGIAFQIADDVLDVVGDEAVLGKRVGSDAAQDKSTYVTLFGTERAEQLMHEAASKARASVKSLGEPGRMLQNMADFAVARDR